MPTRCVTDPSARDTPPPSLYTPGTSRAAMLATLVTTASAIVVLPRSVCNGMPGPEPSGRLPALRVATAALGLLVLCSAITVLHPEMSPALQPWTARAKKSSARARSALHALTDAHTCRLAGRNGPLRNARRRLADRRAYGAAPVRVTSPSLSRWPQARWEHGAPRETDSPARRCSSGERVADERGAAASRRSRARVELPADEDRDAGRVGPQTTRA